MMSNFRSSTITTLYMVSVKKPQKRLDRAYALWYNITLKYVLAFALGMLAHGYIIPPTPQVELDDMDMDRITYNVLYNLEEQGYSISKAREDLVKPKSGWFQ